MNETHMDPRQMNDNFDVETLLQPDYSEEIIIPDLQPFTLQNCNTGNQIEFIEENNKGINHFTYRGITYKLYSIPLGTKSPLQVLKGRKEYLNFLERRYNICQPHNVSDHEKVEVNQFSYQKNPAKRRKTKRGGYNLSKGLKYLNLSSNKINPFSELKKKCFSLVGKVPEVQIQNQEFSDVTHFKKILNKSSTNISELDQPSTSKAYFSKVNSV